MAPPSRSRTKCCAITVVWPSIAWYGCPSRIRYMLCGAVARKGLSPNLTILQLLAVRPDGPSAPILRASSRNSGLPLYRAEGLGCVAPARPETEPIPPPSSSRRALACSSGSGQCRPTSSFSSSKSAIRSASTCRSSLPCGKSTQNLCRTLVPSLLQTSHISFRSVVTPMLAQACTAATGSLSHCASAYAISRLSRLLMSGFSATGRAVSRGSPPLAQPAAPAAAPGGRGTSPRGSARVLLSRLTLIHPSSGPVPVSLR
mmetsp:Transcript_38244/g.108124  ORF Transcript_38244/g.108124 Transcript_38244/m.108124 type:complete len:259 (-) Transcript_38244:249-1025(-)